MMRNLIKCEILKYSKGKTDLVAMDDELPIMIYIVLLANIPNIFAEFSFV